MALRASFALQFFLPERATPKSMAKNKKASSEDCDQDRGLPEFVDEMIRSLTLQKFIKPRDGCFSRE
eukprot:scaffold9738_cov132-Amphora_coffeaeformis.AAC.2